jgi:hypothetical protein
VVDREVAELLTMLQAENDALAAAILYLRYAPADDRLSEVSFGRYADHSGCWWSMKLVTEVRSGQVQASPEDDESKLLMVIAAWRKALIQEAGRD